MIHPSYFSLLREVIKQELDQHNWYKFVIPWLWSLLGMTSGIIVYLLPSDIFSQSSGWLTTVYSALLTAQGLLLSLCIFAFSAILNRMTKVEVERFLKVHGLDIHYYFLIQHITIFQMISLCAQLGGLLLSQIVTAIIWRKIIFFLAVWSFAYAARWAFGTVILIRDLLWYTSKALEDQRQRQIISLEEARFG